MRKMKAFTIIEILITLIIMGTLSATIVPRIGDAKEKANETVEKVNQNKQYACELGLDDICPGSDSNTSSNAGIRYIGEDIQICNNDGDCITMMDKNLGAESDDISSTDSYGYHYQWGNNHGFLSCLSNNCKTFSGNESKTTSRIKCNNPPYDRAQFTYSVGDWCEVLPKHRNLRGGENDNQENNRGLDIHNPTDRQGPCKDGYHVPSIGEWDKLITLWAEINEITLGRYGDGLHRYYGNVEKFFKDFKIPFAGDRYYYDAAIYDIRSEAVFRSSSHSELGSENTSYFVELAGGLIRDGQVGEQSNGFSVRCFKN